MLLKFVVKKIEMGFVKIVKRSRIYFTFRIMLLSHHFHIVKTSLTIYFNENSVFQIIILYYFTSFIDTENIKLVFCAVKDTIMQSALKEFNLA